MVAVPEIDDQFDQTWRSDDAELGLEALAMLDKAADEELRGYHEKAGDSLAKTRKRLALAWLNGQFEEVRWKLGFIFNFVYFFFPTRSLLNIIVSMPLALFTRLRARCVKLCNPMLCDALIDNAL